MLSAWRCSNAILDGIVTAPVFAQIELLDGRTEWQAVCERLGHEKSAGNQGFVDREKSISNQESANNQLYLYSGFGGQGTAPSKTLAARKAICEVLERWAFEVAKNDSLLWHVGGFENDPNTNGMAAYPELWCSKVKEIAKAEAIERWAIQAWWAGEISARRFRVNARVEGLTLLIKSSFSVVIVWTTGEIRAYGFAAALSEAKAT